MTHFRISDHEKSQRQQWPKLIDRNNKNEDISRSKIKNYK